MEHLPADILPLRYNGDIAARMIEGIHRYLKRATAERARRRERYWRRDCRSWGRYERSVAPNRHRLAHFLGVVDTRVPPLLECLEWRLSAKPKANMQETIICNSVRLQAVRWAALPGVWGEGLWLEPQDRDVIAQIVALGDCDWTPEEAVERFAGLLAQNGCRVLVPTLINRDCTWAGVAGIMTNQPHREFIYRAAYELGRHIIGLEVQKILAAVDWLSQQALPVGIVGYGEGGLLAFYSAALDTRLQAALISGYFGPREQLYKEPIYRNVWRLLEEFGDAEIASLIAPRPLIIEHCPFPAIAGPPPATSERTGAAPGAIHMPSLAAVRRELQRAHRLVAPLQPDFVLMASPHPLSLSALKSFWATLQRFAGFINKHPNRQAQNTNKNEAAFVATPRQTIRWDALRRAGLLPDPQARLKRQFEELIEYTQALMRESEYIRKRYWAQADAINVATWQKTTQPYRRRFHEEIIGALPEPEMPLRPRARKAFQTEAFHGYEIRLDVYPDVFAYGLLLVPCDVQPGQKRPVVVCQHGLEGRPQDVADPFGQENCYHYFACRLTERGFVTFSPQNPYIGGDNFRVLQRLANPLGLSLFSFIIRQHQRILEFLKSLPYVDPQKIAFYGLSYGGKTAMRVPAVLPDYCLSICSGDFNEWIWKNCSTRAPFSYMRTGEYEMFEFNLGMTFNYAEMSYLICPRPFMVERGHQDGVSVDEWVAYEYAKTRYLYDLLGIGARTEIEFFNGPHEIHGVGTFAFLERHLREAKPS